MSTLIERANAMVPDMAWIRDAQAQEEQTRALTEADRFLERFQKQTRSVVECAKALSDSGLLPERSLPAQLQFVSEKLTLLREQLTTAPGNIRKHNFWANTQLALSGSVEALEQALLERWQRHLDDLSPPLNELQDLIRSDIFGDDLRRIGQLQNEIDSARGTLPRLLEEIQSVATKGKVIREFVARLNFDEIPPNVKRFLNAVLLGNVNLSELKPDVLAWLVEKNVAKGFRITSVRSR
jgi:hypothetical protein